MLSEKRKNTAWDQYLGYCEKCGKFGALDGEEGLCGECRIKKHLRD